MKQSPAISIKELTRLVKGNLENDPKLQNVWVSGEISNFNRHTSGHLYFSLKDSDSKIKCIMFSSHSQRLPFIPKEGTKVLARGSISVYDRDGNYQFYITQMQPDGMGSLYLAYEQLKQKLEKEGLFAQERKKPIPQFPRAIGVITSPTGAAVQDILTTLQRRYPIVPITVFPVLVQGTQAAPTIVRAIEIMNKHAEVDVLIVGRGGGSLEELWAFNEESVARSIASSAIPIISAVGHETDFTIADFVADLRAATPTAAAELAVPHRSELLQQLYANKQGLHRGLLRQINVKREKLVRLSRSSVLTNPRRQLLVQSTQRFDRLHDQLTFRMNQHISSVRERLSRLEQKLIRFNPKEQVVYARKRQETAAYRLQHSIARLTSERRSLFHLAVRQLDALSPLKVMQRGYSLVYDEKQKTLIKSLTQVQPGDMITVRLTDGSMNCHVWVLEENKNGG